MTNAVKHAYKEKNNVGIINIYFEILEDKIKIIITDKGDSFDYETTKSKIGPYDKDENIDFLREGGLGLFLIESLMDEVTVYKESGVTISMTKYIKKEQVRNNGERVKSANEVSPEQINQWIKEHQENKNTDAQDKLVKHLPKTN